MIATDPIADMLTRIRNAIGANKNEVSLPYSKVKETIAQLLVDSGFLTKVKSEGEGVNRQLIITIHSEGTNAVITEIDRLSKPGRRIYAKADEIPTVKRGRGIIVISTSKGVMTGQQAKAQRLGGELICQVY
jgi:small subunit ribosomal protein S8